MLAGVAFWGSAYTYAQSSQGKYPSIVQKLVQRFGLAESDVQAVFDEAKKEREDQMKTKFEDRLTQAVKDGKLTDTQKQAILTKMQEMQTNRQTNAANWQNMTPEQRKTTFQAQRQELESWAKQNGIDLKYFFGGFGMKGGYHSK